MWLNYKIFDMFIQVINIQKGKGKMEEKIAVKEKNQNSRPKRIQQSKQDRIRNYHLSTFYLKQLLKATCCQVIN